jgi:hypothetical protein
MPNTVKYCLKTDRQKTVDVISPFFTMATVIDAKGVKTELHRGDFEALYEPLLPKPNLENINVDKPSEAKATMERIEKKVDQLLVMISAIHDVATVPKPEEKPAD